MSKTQREAFVQTGQKVNLYHQADKEKFKWKSVFQLKVISPVSYMMLQYVNNLKQTKF